MATFVAVVQMLTSLLRINHVPALDELGLMIESLGNALFGGAVIWLFYMAAEPYVRRLWPNSLIAWTRLLDGRFRDPLLGRHLLIGAISGIGFSVFFMLNEYALQWLGKAPDALFFALAYQSTSFAAAGFLNLVHASFLLPVSMLLIVLVLRVLLRRQWLAIAVFLAIAFGLGMASEPAYAVVNGVGVALFMSIFLFVLIRFGLFAGLLAIFFSSWPAFALTVDPSSWYFGRSLVTMLVFAVLAVYGFVISLSGRPIFKDSVFDDPA